MRKRVGEAKCRRVETVDLVLVEGEFEKTKEGVEDLRRHLPDVDVKAWEKEEARERFGVGEHVTGAISYEAGDLWPYRLVTSIWQRLLSDLSLGIVVETSTPLRASTMKDRKSTHFECIRREV